MPFLVRYYKEISVGLLIVAVVALAVWVRGVVADNAAMRKEVKDSQQKLDQKVAEMDRMIKLNKEVADAIKKVRVQSNNYITSIETSKAPVLHAGGTGILIPGGVPQAPTTVFSAISSAR